MQPRHDFCRNLVGSMILILSVSCSGNSNPEVFVGETVARVNGVDVAAFRLDKMVEGELDRIKATGEAGKSETELRREILDLLIGRELMKQDARKGGMTVPPDVLDEQVNAARSQFTTEEEFHSYLASSGNTVEVLRERAADTFLLEAYIKNLVGDLEISDAEVRQAYEERKNSFLTPEEVHALHIFIGVKRKGDPEANVADSAARAERVHEQIKAGGSFHDLALEHSTGPSKFDGGDMGFFPRGRWREEFDDVVFKAELGLLDVFRTPLGFHVVELLEKRPPQPQSFEEIENTLTLTLTRERREEVLKKNVERLRETAEIEILDPSLR